MSETRSSADSADSRDDPSSGDRLRHRLPDPTQLSLLGFISVPGYLFDAFESLQPFVLFFLFGFWPLLTSVTSDDADDPTAWVEMGNRSSRPFYLSLAYQQLNPYVQLQGIRQLLGHLPILARYRGRLPTPDRYVQSTSFHLPFEGEWTVVNGSYEREHSHSWGVLTQRYAYDFVITDDEGRTHTGDGTSPEDYYCYGEPVLAPADGVVVATNDGHRDYHRAGGWLDPTQRDIRGNWVAIEHDGGEYSLLAHLQCESVLVAAGDRVERGQQVGRCGHSGNSTEPHLHVHVQDHPDFFLGMGLPVQFDDVTTRTGPSASETTHSRAFLTAGDLVRPSRTETTRQFCQ
ncbi:Peptidase family M23 [Halogranum rubrum]|uniref:Peptidase family M23 n=1 Tax=Halogranum rubrum TaxID=553466 RepID=A0A1I4GA24_9EURY|nr:M23 family metallopeptidase [Halogranum rubrum]SFL26360.1 Peptidase family M23 [Halogranum rubrum]